jgi:predicted transcriptional regulator
MNTTLLARTTFVLDRATHDQLDFISRRMKVSRSELVREVLAEPVALMAKWVESVPEHPTEASNESTREVVQQDLVDFIERQHAKVEAFR